MGPTPPSQEHTWNTFNYKNPVFDVQFQHPASWHLQEEAYNDRTKSRAIGISDATYGYFGEVLLMTTAAVNERDIRVLSTLESVYRARTLNGLTAGKALTLNLSQAPSYHQPVGGYKLHYIENSDASLRGYTFYSAAVDQIPDQLVFNSLWTVLTDGEERIAQLRITSKETALTYDKNLAANTRQVPCGVPLISAENKAVQCYVGSAFFRNTESIFGNIVESIKPY